MPKHSANDIFRLASPYIFAANTCWIKTFKIKTSALPYFINLFEYGPYLGMIINQKLAQPWFSAKCE